MSEKKEIKAKFQGKEANFLIISSYEQFISNFQNEFLIDDEKMKKIRFNYFDNDNKEITIDSKEDFLSLYNLNNQKEKIVEGKIENAIKNGPPPPPPLPSPSSSLSPAPMTSTPLISNRTFFFFFGIVILIIAILISFLFLTRNSKTNQNNEKIIEAKIENKKQLPNNKRKIKKVINLKKHNQELVEILNKVNEKISFFLSLSSYYNNFIDDEIILKEVRKLGEKYYSFLNIKRFAIPVIGSVGVGKSTLLNYLLNLNNFLGTDEKIKARFLCLIRHNINYKKPVISNITIEDRGNFKYNFAAIKNQEEYENEFDSIKEYIKFFGLTNNIKIEETYFLLIEVDIPLFHGDFEKYADLIEFIDIPGLNEKDSIINEQIIPFIQQNYLFSLFLFENMDFQSKDTKVILMNFTDAKYLEKCLGNKPNIGNEKNQRNINLKNIFKESLFILNQKNKNENTNLKDFKELLENIFKEKNITIYLEDNKNILEINLKILNLELNKFNSFEDYLIYSNNNIDSGLIESFVKNLNKDFNLDLDYYNIVMTEELNNLINDEKEEKNRINNLINGDKLKYSQYKKLKEIFNNLSKDLKNNNENILTKIIKNKIKLLIDDYLNITGLNNLNNSYINYLSKKNINDVENNYLKLLDKKQKKIRVEKPKEFIEQFEIYMKELFKFKGENKDSIDSLYNKFEEIKEYSDKQFLSSLVLIGEYSSGKSSFINSLIGSNLNLLQTKSTECSQVAIIVRYIEKKEKITLYSATLESRKFDFFFKEDKKIAEGEIDVKNEIVKLNEKKKFGYYILYVYIQAFDDLHFELELKKKIELIDFPGLASYQSNDKNEKEKKKILEKENAFIFLTNGNNFDKNQNQDIIKFIYEIISKKNNYFNINNSLFIITFPGPKEKLNLEYFKKKLIESFDKQTEEHCLIKRKDDRNFINENKLIITPFNSPLYEDYLEFDRISYNFSLFTENLINDCKNDKIFYKCVKSKLINKNYYKFAENYATLEIKDKKEKEKYNIILKDILKNNSIYMTNNNISEYIEYYLKIKENKHLYLSYINSYYEETIQHLKKIISNIEIMIINRLNLKIQDFSNELFKLFGRMENLILQKNVTIITEEVKEIKKIINKAIKDLNDSYSFEKEEIKKLFEKTKIELNLTNVENIDYNSSKEIFLKSEEKIKKDYIKNISNLDDSIGIHFTYFERNSKKILEDLNNEKLFKIYFEIHSSEYNQKIQMIEEYKSKIKEDLQITEYKEYDYFEDDEGYKNSYMITKPFKCIKGGIKNLIHNYIKDQKERAQTVISEIKLNFGNLENNTLEYIENQYNNENSKLISYQEFLNSKWDNIIKNKSEYLDLSKRIIKYIEIQLFTN